MLRLTPMYRGKEITLDEAYLLSQKCEIGLIPANIYEPFKTIDMHEPSCKCAYCGCTNDHIYGTCDYCGAPLSIE